MAVVHVPPSEATPVAKALLEAAAALGLPASVVQTSSDGAFGFSFLVPDEVSDFVTGSPAEPKESEPEVEEPPAPKKRGRPAKKAAATESVVEEEE